MNSNSKNNEPSLCHPEVQFCHPERSEGSTSLVPERIVPMRLQKFLARAGVASRRGSENLMTAGRVKVNGEVVTELGSRVDPLVDEVTVDGQVIPYPGSSVTIMLNKPAGYITTMYDPHERPCVATLIPLGRYPGLYPVGRLDADSTGLLLFSTDGELGNNLLHPRNHVTKRYEVAVKGKLSESSIKRFQEGIELEDGLTLPAELEILASGKISTVRVSIREGRKRQIRRMFEELGNPVVSLHRFAFGQLVLGNLESGAWRELSQKELSLLKP